MNDVLVAGAGPAGWALASACARLGLDTALVALAPWRRWRATYGLWRDELPELPAYAIASAPARTLAVGTSPRLLDRQYLVADNDGLRRWLTHPDVTVLTGHAAGHHARVVVNATGAQPVGAHTEQTAYGLLLDATSARSLVPPDTALVMDWSRPARERSFLYAMPVGDRVFVEETCLARRPGLPLEVLAARLRHRLAKAGIPVEGREETVRIPLDLPRSPGLTFGAAAGLVHPATGYSLAASLRLAPLVAEAIREGLRTSPAEAVRAAHHVIWPPAALAVQALRKYGLRVLRRMPSDILPEFFDNFFRMPVELQIAFTSERNEFGRTAAAMGRMFRTGPWRLRARLIR